MSLKDLGLLTVALVGEVDVLLCTTSNLGDCQVGPMGNISTQNS